eukprot:TRINITY_DN12907_c0_g3_i1.p1 TRINITY_DN12907_c0_g3~~TRINITY_DN12907_c0_g3_i1.p1  ORF type:complete len:246 (+),score=43.77 TRINITY_DN12907_c0_g3_i1:36-773(+)
MAVDTTQGAASREISPFARTAIGFAAGFLVLVLLFLIPGLRAYVGYEYETGRRKLLIGRLCGLVSFCILIGTIFNNYFMAGSSDFNCAVAGCGNNWKALDGSETEQISNFVMFKGTSSELALAVAQQVLLWVTPNLRGVTVYSVLIWITVIPALSWYVAYIVGIPAGIAGSTMLVQAVQILLMIVAIVLVKDDFRYNDTLFDFRSGEEMAQDALVQQRRASARNSTLPSQETASSEEEMGVYFRT